MTQEQLLKRLQKPTGMVDVILDTDTFNEIDDQYALAYLIKSSEKLNLKAIYAAPFFNDKATSPKDGMEKSYQEILHVLDLMDEHRYDSVVYKGSETYLSDEQHPVISPAAKDLVARAMVQPDDKPLYVVAIAAITNIASALLLEPKIADKIVIVWLGGHSYEWHDSYEFNMFQDVAAARVVFDSKVPVVQLPCMGVVSHFTITGPELEYWFRGKNKLCDYLVDVTTKEAKHYHGDDFWSRVIWDVTAVAWLLDGNFLLDRLEYAPIPQYDHHYSFDPTRHFIRYVYGVHRDNLMKDLYLKLTQDT